MDKQRALIEQTIKNVRPRIKFPDDQRDIVNAYDIYKPSFESENLLSEEGRTLYAEAFKFGTEEDEETPLSLRTAVVTEIVKTYDGGPLSDTMTKYDKFEFGQMCNIEMPLDKLAHLDDEPFWRRVCDKKCRNRYIYHKINCNIKKNCTWRQFGIESKLAEIIETSAPDHWDDYHVEDTIKIVAPYVEHLQINQLMPLKILDSVPEDPSFQIVNAPMVDCHHGDLSILRHLSQLRMLQIEFGMENLEFSYDKQYFQFSYDDVKNLASALQNLTNLQQFRLRCSPINDKKLKILIKSLEKIRLTELDFSYCNLDDDCATTLGQYLFINSTLKALELRGNFIGPVGAEAIGCGIKQFKGELYYLGLSQNPLLEAGILSIGGGIIGTQHVKKLDLTCCDLGGVEGGFTATKIIGFHHILLKLFLPAVELGVNGGDKIIEALTTNTSIIKLDVRGCGLHLNQMVKIRILVDRNIYFAENPCLNKSVIQPEDVPIIEAWLKRVKHPLLLKLQERPDSIDSFDQSLRKCHYDHKTIPKFISQNQQRIPTNEELLGGNYIDGFGEDRTVKFEPIVETGPKYKDPNYFTEQEFGEHFIVGCPMDLVTFMFTVPEYAAVVYCEKRNLNMNMNMN